MMVEKLSALLSDSHVATVAVNLEYGLVWQNDAFAQRFLSHEGLRDVLTLEFKVSPIDADRFLASADVCELTTKLDHIYYIKKYIFTELSICVVCFESSPQRVQCDFCDTFFDKIFIGSGDAVAVFSHETGHVRYFNTQFADVLGVPPVYIACSAKPHNLYTRATQLLQNPDVRASRRFTTESARLNGESVLIEVQPTLMTIEGEEIVILKVADVTSKLCNEAEQAKLLHELFFEQRESDDAMLVSENNVITDANEQACKIWGYNSPKDIIGKHICELVKKEYADNFFSSDESEWAPFAGITKELKVFNAEQNSRLQVNRNHKAYITTVRMLYSAAQNRDAAFYTGLLDAQPNPVLIYKLSGELVRCNKCLLDLFKCNDTESFKEQHVDISKLFIEEDTFMSAAKYGTDWYMAPYRDPRKEYLIKICANDGEPRIFSVFTNVIESFGTEYAVASLTDVTETVQQKYILIDVNNMLQDKYEDVSSALSDNMATLVQQSKLATMGEMIGAISHQWKQPLNTIGLIAQNVEDMVEDQDEPISHEEISSMMKSVMKYVIFMSETVDNFRDFFKKNTQRLFFPITNAVDSTLNLVSPVIGKSRITVETVFPENHTSLTVFGFPNDFKQVLMNVLINGMDSINSKIKTGNAPEGSGKIIIRMDKTDKYEVTLTITDNGLGLSNEAAENMFKLNFTTKGEAGTGLGLYMSKRIIDSLGGDVVAHNHSCGAEIAIKLPIVDKANPRRR